MKKNFILPAFTVCGIFIMSSCHKSDVANPQPAFDASVVSAAHDTTVFFSNFKTIALPDSVKTINNGTASEEMTSTDAAYITDITDSLTLRGFTIVPLSSNPDIVLNITKITGTADGEVDTTSYWNNYGTYYNPAAYNFSGVSYTNNLNQTPISLNGQALSFEMLDLKDVAASNTIKIIWDGIVDGSSVVNNNVYAQPAVGALLSESSYLVSH